MRERIEPLLAQIYLCMDMASGRQRVVDTGRRFFRLGFDLLGHELRDRVARALEDGTYLGHERRRAKLGGVSASCNLDLPSGLGREKKRAFTYSPKKFSEMLDLFDRNPTFASLGVDTWGERSNTDLLVPVDPTLDLTWNRSTTKWAAPLPDWVLLYVHSSYRHLLGSRERQDTALAFLEQVADSANPACGEISYAPQGQSDSAPLEYLLSRNRSWRESVAESRHTVRSYSWVTIISEEIGQRLGGRGALQESGAFYRVKHMSGGGFLLQATEWFEQYQHEQAYRVFRVLAPALPPGIPDAPRVYRPEWNINLDDDPDFMIVQQDPSSVRGEG